MKRLVFTSILALFFVTGYSGAQVEKIVNGDFEAATTDPWTLEQDAPATCTLEASTVSPISGTKSGHVTVTATSTTAYFLQLIQAFAMEANKKYVLTYKVKASADVTITTYIQENHSPYGGKYAKDINLTPTAQTFKDSLNIYSADPQIKLAWFFGTLAVGTELWFDDVSIVESDLPVDTDISPIKAPGTEIILNGKFEGGTTPWVTELTAPGAATFSLDNVNPIQGTQSVHIQVTNAGTADYQVQFRQLLQVKQGKRYFTAYKARASIDNVVIKAGIQEYHSPYGFLTPFKAETLKVATRTVLDTSGYMAANDDNVKFTFFLGNQGTFDVWIDFVTVIENTMADSLNIVIDAARDAWYDGLTNPDDGKIFIPQRAYLRDVGVSPTDNNDCSAILWSAWDRNYLYYYAEVHDDAILCNNTTNWSNDKIELKFDPDPTIIATGGALQVGMSALGLDDPGIVAQAIDNLDADDNLYFADRTVWVPTADDYARGRTDNGYILEWRIPLAAVNGSDGVRKLAPGVGGKFGLAVNVADNDDTQRNGMLQWSSGMADNAWSNPQKHGTVSFLSDNKLRWRAVSSQDSVLYHNDSAYVWYYGDAGPGTLGVGPGYTLPGSYALMQNYPNPFNPTTTIEFTVPATSNVRITLVNILGQVVKEIVKDRYAPGTHTVSLDASHLSTGVYFYRLQAGDFVDVKKLVLLR